MLKTFFKTNGFKGNSELEVESFHQPARARTRREYIPILDEAQRMANVAGSLRDRAIILFLVSTGLRNSTLRSVLYNEIKEELGKGFSNILIRIHTDMKKVVPTACKGNTEYFVFTSEEATEALLLYIDYRRRRFGEIHDQEFLFPSEYNRLPFEERGRKPLTSRELQIIVKKCARKAGIKEWMNVTPHCLRKTFESVLRSRLADGGRLDLKTQEFFMGHILAGSMDTYYDKTKVDELRKEYSKLIFSHDQRKIEVLKPLRLIAEALDIDIAQLVESKKTEIRRPLTSAEEMELLQEEVRKLMRMLREHDRFNVGTSSANKTNENKSLATKYRQTCHNENSMAEKPLTESPSCNQPPESLSEKKTHTVPEKHQKKIKSPQLTSYFVFQENGNRRKPPVNLRQQQKPKSDIQTKLLSFIQSAN